MYNSLPQTNKQTKNPRNRIETSTSYIYAQFELFVSLSLFFKFSSVKINPKVIGSNLLCQQSIVLTYAETPETL